MSRKLRKNGESELRRSPCFENLESRHLLSGNPIISEFMASNESTLRDNAFPRRFSDWIEIYNSGDEAMDLAGWHLTDRPNNLNKWTFPSVILPAEGFLHVFASGNDVPDGSGNLHTNFSLDREGEYLALVQPDGTSLASEFGSTDADYPEQFSDVSYGLTQELAPGGAINTLEDQLRYFQTPTPGEPNIPGSRDLGPIISATTHTPDVPDFGEDVVVSAMVREGAGTLRTRP
ncbi:MAG: lamin tail domain-containing protein [Planctomycetes bacterium]|nr:lamin tail domain-containing protein [Planctomycetota bacterium]